MDFSEGPAALGGIMMCVALGAWTLGRWQGGLVAGESRDAVGFAGAGGQGQAAPQHQARDMPSPEVPCQNPARAERHMTLGAVGSLGELHAEMIAYRRAEQVLAGFDGDLSDHRQAQIRPIGDCRFFGLNGEPTCGAPQTARAVCGCTTQCDPAGATIAVPLPHQLSVPLSGLTRV